MSLLSRLAAPALMLAALPAAALDLDAMTDDERTAFRAEVRSYLLENPEVLMEAIAVLETREQQAQAVNDQQLVTTYLAALQDDPGAWVGGNPDGDITIVEFMDYRCSYCKRAFAEVEELIESDGNIRFILREFPILGEQSTLAARFALATRAAHGDEAYKDMHDAMMTMRADVSEEILSQLAVSFGYDPEPIFAGLDDPEITRVIEDTLALARTLQITGTPTFVMEDQMVRGYVPLAQMQAQVAALRADD